MLNRDERSPVKLVPLIRRKATQNLRYITPGKVSEEILNARKLVGKSSENLKKSVSPLSPDRYSTKFAFYEGYKKINTNSFANLERSSPQMSYLKELTKSHKKPETLRLFTEEEENVISLDIKEYGIGDEYATVFSAAIKELPRLEKLNLKNNRLRDNGATIIIANVNKRSLRCLDLSGNTLGRLSIMGLCDVLRSENCCLEVLKLESSKLSTESIKILTEGLHSNMSLKHLNLAKNNLNENSGIYLGKLVMYNRSLISLDLH